jgi:hypothetical protein
VFFGKSVEEVIDTFEPLFDVFDPVFQIVDLVGLLTAASDRIARFDVVLTVAVQPSREFLMPREAQCGRDQSFL